MAAPIVTIAVPSFNQGRFLEQALTSRALRAACDEASPTVLQARLSDLRKAGLVELIAGNGYRLTAMGRELHETFLPLHGFAERWSKLNAN